MSSVVSFSVFEAACNVVAWFVGLAQEEKWAVYSNYEDLAECLDGADNQVRCSLTYFVRMLSEVYGDFPAYVRDNAVLLTAS